ncbi:MAG TPA: class I SAM-dependent methyltransferase [Thermoleophilaceae bacterium]|nr:class I SAM-dependent methyltransferase [Thermoleophilaceae bacterium]
MGRLNAVWHDVECSGYTADLDLWRELAQDAGGPVLDLGCGTGRVALHLARAGVEVTGIDSDPALVAALRTRAREEALRIEAVAGDVRSFELDRRFALAISPMQVVQLLGGRAGRLRTLTAVRRHLEPGAVFAAALADPFDGWSETESLPPLPDVLEAEGWVYSSTPVGVRRAGGSFVIERHRQAVSPTGEITEERAAIELDSVRAEELEQEASDAGYRPGERRTVAGTPEYVGSSIVMLEAV